MGGAMAPPRVGAALSNMTKRLQSMPGVSKPSHNGLSDTKKMSIQTKTAGFSTRRFQI